MTTPKLNGLHHQVVSQWYQTPKFFWWLLYPFQWLYRGMVMLRSLAYRYKIFKTVQFAVPVIVVGNITVGGVGKTPFVIQLAEFLIAQGYRPGIVTRGYLGKAKTEMAVTPTMEVSLVGDEAILLSQRTHCPVVVGANRVAAVKKLLNDYHCNIVISDDGLQHLRLGRALEIVIWDGQRGAGNGHCLPMGPLRESIKRLARVDAVVIRNPGMVDLPITIINKFVMTLTLGQAYALLNPQQIISWEQLKNTPVHAVAGIGNPSQFFTQLKNLGLTIIEHPFPDHYQFTAQDLIFNDHYPILMTEKDAVKCHAFAQSNCWCVPVITQLDPILLSFIMERLASPKA